ncbi:MAG: cysteine hydrolase family protein [Desulfuromonadaceae bacterium]|nr:cysteine hydrolase family protein [Desulfuromonadaceae bacterium]MDD5106633.1 cysteine hydrolase family protein [Desulfuromonadaceae bacterium]
MSTALILIDIQNDYFPGGRMELAGSIEAATATARLIAAFRKSSWPVIHIRHIAAQPMATFFIPGTAGADIHQSVAPLPDEPVIVKHFPNSFRETTLLEQLRTSGVDTLLVCGMMSHMCVDATVRAAFDVGFSCIVVHDACATRELTFNGVVVPANHVHASYMAALGAVYAQVKCMDEILENMTATT